jgi:hypothetical protein
LVIAGITFPIALQWATGDVTLSTVVHFLASLVYVARSPWHIRSSW